MIRQVMLLILMLYAAAPALAHQRSESFSSWTASSAELTGSVETDARRATQLVADDADLADLGVLFAAHVSKAVSLRQGGAACKAAPARVLASEPGMVRAELAFTCPKPIAGSRAQLQIDLFAGRSQAHVHYVRVSGVGGAPIEAVLSGAMRTLPLDAPSQKAAPSFFGFFKLGFFHVLAGLDHVAFVAALALLAQTWRAAALAASGFTLGHSLTLGLAALGWLHPNGQAIEALIGFTVAFAAGEALARTGAFPRWTGLGAAALVLAAPLIAALLGRAAAPFAVFAGIALFVAGAAAMQRGAWLRSGPWLAAGFGLAHGAGFAGPLLTFGLPPERLAPGLLAFNLGVEAAQLLLLSAFGFLALALRLAPNHVQRWNEVFVASMLLGLGVYWFTSRAIG